MASDVMPPEHMRPHLAERSLIGDALRDPDTAIDAALRHISGPEDFYFFAHGTVFGVCRDLYTTAKAGGPYDVFQELVRRGQAADVGGAEWLVEAWESVPTGANAEYHAALVREAALRRQLWHAAREILSDAERAPTCSAEDALAASATKVQDLIDKAAGRSSSSVRLGTLLNEALIAIDDRVANPHRRPGLSSGFPALDAVIGGFRAGQLVVIAARPSVGKTALLLAMAAAVAGAGAPAFMASLEMPRSEIAERLLAMSSGVRLHDIRSGRLDPDEQRRLVAAVGPEGYGRSELFVDDTPIMSTARFGATVRTHVRRHGVKLAAADFLQLLQPSDPRESRVLQVGRMSRDLKVLARECNIPVLAPCQLNREVENRTDGRPKLSDLRDSGEIEQNADVVIGLYVPDRQPDGDTLAVTAVVLKNRNGQRDVEVPLRYRKSLTRFETAAYDF